MLKMFYLLLFDHPDNEDCIDYFHFSLIGKEKENTNYIRLCLFIDYKCVTF